MGCPHLVHAYFLSGTIAGEADQRVPAKMQGNSDRIREVAVQQKVVRWR